MIFPIINYRNIIAPQWAVPAISLPVSVVEIRFVFVAGLVFVLDVSLVP